VLIVAGAIAAGWISLWQDRRDEALWARFGSEALTAYVSLNRGDSQPAMAASLQEVAAFFSAKLKTPVRLHEPADRNYALVGSEFLSGAQGRVAQLVFRSPDGTLVTMYFEPWPRKKDAPFRPVASQANVTTLVWVDDEIGCAVTGTLPRYELERVGRSLYAELTKS
jgi:anti-sigma factor RsiW